MYESYSVSWAKILLKSILHEVENQLQLKSDKTFHDVKNVYSTALNDNWQTHICALFFYLFYADSLGYILFYV